MRLLFVAGSMAYGGAERVMSVLCNQLAADGNTIRILVTSTEERTGYPLSENVEIISIVHKLEGKKFIQFPIIAEIRKMVKAWKPDIVISFYNNLCAFASIALAGQKIPLVYSERNDPDRTNQRHIEKIYRKIVEKKADFFIFQTKGAQKCYPEFVQNKSKVILNPVDTERLPDRDVNTIDSRIVTIGRLAEQKNQKLLIEAFDLIKEEFPETELAVYGVGPLKAALDQQILSKNLESKVHLMGATNQAHKILSEAKLFVLSSDYEGMPNVLAEAMTIGVPSVSTDCSPGGAAELIVNGENGILVPCGDAEKLAAGMRQCLKDQDMAEKMGRRAKELRKRVNTDRICNQWNSVFEKLLEQ